MQRSTGVANEGSAVSVRKPYFRGGSTPVPQASDLAFGVKRSPAVVSTTKRERV